jgi:hypothetical protein
MRPATRMTALAALAALLVGCEATPVRNAVSAAEGLAAQSRDVTAIVTDSKTLTASADDARSLLQQLDQSSSDAAQLRAALTAADDAVAADGRAQQIRDSLSHISFQASSDVIAQPAVDDATQEVALDVACTVLRSQLDPAGTSAVTTAVGSGSVVATYSAVVAATPEAVLSAARSRVARAISPALVRTLDWTGYGQKVLGAVQTGVQIAELGTATNGADPSAALHTYVHLCLAPPG